MDLIYLSSNLTNTKMTKDYLESAKKPFEYHKMLKYIIPYVRYKTSRSSGSGGQNVNKVASKVELLFDFKECELFSEEERTLINERLSSKIQSDGLLQVISQESRSQLENKDIALQKLIALLSNALKVEKKRKKTKPSKKAIQKRLDSKRKQALKKINRKAPQWEWDKHQSIIPHSIRILDNEIIEINFIKKLYTSPNTPFITN